MAWMTSKMNAKNIFFFPFKTVNKIIQQIKRVSSINNQRGLLPSNDLLFIKETSEANTKFGKLLNKNINN